MTTRSKLLFVALLGIALAGTLAFTATFRRPGQQEIMPHPSPASADEIGRVPITGDPPAISATDDWPWWRGPRGDGHAAPTAAPPTKWSATENVVWKVAVPGRGHSSPIIVGNQIFLTTADEASQVRSILAFAKEDGRQLWTIEASRGGFPEIHRNNTHATPTVASDGRRLFAVFHHHDQLQCVALNFDGNKLWDRSLGKYQPTRYEFGYGPSPIPYRSGVVVAAEYDGPSRLVALDGATGETRWETPRPENMSFSSPALLRMKDRDVFAISGANQIAVYDAATGALLWNIAATTAATCGTIVSEGDMIYASGGFPKSETTGVRDLGDRGEVVWKNGQKCYEQSMIVVDGHLYALTDNGVLYCWRAADGKEMWRERLRGPVSASPVFAGGHIYWANEAGTMYVFKTNPQKCEMVAENKLGDEAFASPAVVGNRMYLRVADSSSGTRQEYLYCLGR